MRIHAARATTQAQYQMTWFAIAASRSLKYCLALEGNVHAVSITGVVQLQPDAQQRIGLSQARGVKPLPDCRLVYR
jgi:hypothetical protein